MSQPLTSLLLYVLLAALLPVPGLAAPAETEITQKNLEPNQDIFVPPAVQRALPKATAQTRDEKIPAGTNCRSMPPVASGLCFARKLGPGLCQPQCIPYIRCRSGLSSCRLGNTSPVQLFHCEKKRNNTSRIPLPGSLLSIGIERKHNITTGHTLYVEEVCDLPDGSYKVRVSHSNYDRKCHLDENAWMIYDPKQMTANFISGEWKVWAKRLPVQGYILTGNKPSQP